MTPAPMQGTPPQGGAPGMPGAQPPGGQATGTSPATMPVANRGLEAQALSRLRVYVQGIQTLLAVMPAGSDMARDVRSALDKLAKHVPPGGGNPGVEMTETQRMLMQQRQMGPQIAAMRAGTPPAQPAAPPSPMQAA